MLYQNQLSLQLAVLSKWKDMVTYLKHILKSFKTVTVEIH